MNPNLRVSASQIALADLSLPRQSISFRSSWRTDGSHQDTACEVDFVKLDDWLVANDVGRVDLIKLDVDGNEYGVLAGGIEMLKRDKPIFLMEMVGPHFADSNRNPYLLLESLGYKFSNTDTGAVYSGVDAMRGLIPADDTEMTASINILGVVPRV